MSTDSEKLMSVVCRTDFYRQFLLPLAVQSKLQQVLRECFGITYDVPLSHMSTYIMFQEDADAAGGERIVAMGSYDSRTGHLYNICVIPELQGQGYGCAFMTSILPHIHSSPIDGTHVKHVFLEVESDRAFRLYSKVGFVEYTEQGQKKTMVLNF